MPLRGLRRGVQVVEPGWTPDMEQEWLRQMRALFVLSQYRRARHYLTWQQREEREKGSLSPMRTFTITVHGEDYDVMYRAIAEALEWHPPSRRVERERRRGLRD